MIVAPAARAAALAHAVAARLATDRLPARRELAALRLAICVSPAGQRHRQAAAAASRALKAGALDAARVLAMHDASPGLSRRITALANAVARRVAAHAVRALVARAIRGRAADLPFHEQARAAYFELLNPKVVTGVNIPDEKK